MQKFIFTLLVTVVCVLSSHAQRSGPIRQGPWPSPGGGSPLGPSGGILTTNLKFLNSVLLSDGTIYYWGSYTNFSGQATNAIGNLHGSGTNTALYGSTTNAALWVTDIATFANNVVITGDLSIPNYLNVADALDGIAGKQQGSFVLTNFVAMGITNIVSANANIVITTNAGVLVFTGSGSGGSSSGTNYAGIIVTNVIERQVLWTTTTNLTVDWNGPDEIIWAPTGVTASLAFTGNPGNLTNAVSKILKLRLTDSGTTTITWPTNGIDGLSPKTLTAPSTNEYLLKYDGQIVRVDSFQSFSTGSGEVIVVNTNPVIYTPTIRYVPTLISGAGGDSTNHTLLSTYPEMYTDNPTALSITASMGYNESLVDYWTLITTNGSGTNRTIQFVATTNNWRFSGVYGTNAPSVITNNTRLEISGRQKGTNVQVLYSYTPWP